LPCPETFNSPFVDVDALQPFFVDFKKTIDEQTMSPKHDDDDWENESAKGKEALPDAPLKRILKSAGNVGGAKAIHAGEGAVTAFRKAVEAYAYKLAGIALKMARQAKRNTISEDGKNQDISLALEFMKK